MSRRPSLLPWISLSIVYVVWGSTYLAIRFVVREMPPFAAASLRFSTAGSALLLFCALSRHRRPRPTLRQWGHYSIAGGLMLAGGNAGVMWAERRVPSGLAALLVATVPLWITFLEGLRRGGQRWTWRAWGGVLLGFVGVGIVAQPEGAAGDWAGIAVLQVAALFWTLGVLYAQSIPDKLPTFLAAGIEMFSGSILLLALSRLAGENLSLVTHASPRAWLAWAFLMTFGSLLAFTAFAYSLSSLPATTVGTYAYVNPVVAVVLGRVVLREPLPSLTALGGLLIVVAVVVTTHGVKPLAAEP
jgi:drug/metabolite transporter (DMT)-like permease